ncbi:Cation efflux family protein [Chitinophaga eiseniae]|uniref:Cation efflux family protein n=1 Tax=Chitinophaga eiseniae TaxID=634771 RepID=A0A1T4QSR5_9BACT|nr:cation transporter [Chitinophaga eiseniae]SKA06734.1 Cation efflux family protein [Chitinophaga eiseniae]
MQKSTFHIKKMDCSAEEQLIRMKLEGIAGIKQLVFDLPNRKLEILHTGEVQPITAAIHELNLNDNYISSEQADGHTYASSERNERKLLIYVLIINAFFFILEIVTGFISHSMGLVADSLDMLADALVYSLSLFAVGGTIMRKKKIAKVSGYFQLALALFGFSEVVRRFMGFGEMPVFSTMIYISFFALIGNTLSLVILRKAKSDEAHIKASWIFTSNDVIINIGVMLAGALVYFTSSRLPDLIIGTIVFGIVIQGAFRILKL